MKIEQVQQAVDEFKNAVDEFKNAIDELLNEEESSESASREDKIRTMIAAAINIKETLIEIRAQHKNEWAEITDKLQKIESDFNNIYKK